MSVIAEAVAHFSSLDGQSAIGIEEAKKLSRILENSEEVFAYFLLKRRSFENLPDVMMRMQLCAREVWLKPENNDDTLTEEIYHDESTQSGWIEALDRLIQHSKELEPHASLVERVRLDMFKSNPTIRAINDCYLRVKTPES
ncbi:hypothetical protein [Roseomonas mucosa]|uniref:hypothetical protein n=1 Tax=Roseomonas mucosa TaxID=207340 RepID=UPI0028CF7C96|nr:hypothetical protein [Roseomonas mucosa]MDT8315771.1 hypothetical protein [Roseomonas mucosa]MDT8362168.1 hypothetical protein [Roseomonas mucosa]